MVHASHPAATLTILLPKGQFDLKLLLVKAMVKLMGLPLAEQETEASSLADVRWVAQACLRAALATC
jgi:hypothetical protein